MLGDRFLRLFPLSYKKIFCNSLLNFLSTKKVNPLNRSLNCCDLIIVGKKLLKFSWLSNFLDLFNARESNKRKIKDKLLK